MKILGKLSWLYAAVHTRKNYNKKKYDQALEIGLYALKKSEEIYGEEHLNTNRSLYNLAAVYTKLGNYEEAEKIALRAIKITEQNWGENHIKLIEDLRNLINIYKHWNKEEELQIVQERLERITSGDCEVE